MDIKCRACLATTDAKMYHVLSTVFPEYMKTSLTVMDLLEIVTSTSVAASNRLPNLICTACLKQLKDSYNFIQQFKNAQSFLQENYCEDAEQENILVKVETLVENIDDEFSDPVIVDEEGNDILETSFLDTVIEDYKGRKKQDRKTLVKVRRANKTVQVNKKRAIHKKKNAIRSVKENNGDVIIMSIEDVLQEENERAENDACSDDSAAKESDHLDYEENTTDTDHMYLKNTEDSIKSNRNLCVMSIKDVLNSASRLRTGVKKKRTKGIITQSTELLQNLERKTATRRARKTKTDDGEGQNFKCDLCQRVYESRKSLTTHKYSVHVPEWQDKFKCGICGVQCKTRSSYTHHKRKHKGKQISCDECEKVYLTTTQLKQHKSRIHGNGVPAKYLCNECGKRFKYSNALQYHVVSTHHANDKPYMCRFCGFKCVQKSYIKRHERCHTDERPYKCKFCDRTFRGTAELQSHQFSHEGKTKYNCKYCGKGFIQTWNMKVHWLQHGGKYDCEICDRSFVDEDVLNFHYYHHHKIRDDGKEASEDTNSNDDKDSSEPVFFEIVDDSFSHGIY